MMKLSINNNIKQLIPNCRLGYAVIDETAVQGSPPTLSREFYELQAAAAAAYKIELLPTNPRIAAVRAMYKKLTIDPSHYRPASEALVRRVLNGKGLYYINSAVDVNNYCSLKFLLPFGLYAADKIEGDVEYALAEAGSYVNIAGKTSNTDHKPFLGDKRGVFGNPTADAGRTAVTLQTTRLLSVIYADEEVSNQELEEILQFTIQMLVRYNSGEVCQQGIISA
jgi:DNA/RNA-binding domain of Phe-tRNA-synthetase-like protein